MKVVSPLSQICSKQLKKWEGNPLKLNQDERLPTVTSKRQFRTLTVHEEIKAINHSTMSTILAGQDGLISSRV